MLSVSPRIYAQAIWQLFKASPANERPALLTRVAQDLVWRYRRPQREWILRALADEEAAGQGIKPVRVWAASAALAEAVRPLFAGEPVEVTVAPQLKKGVILEQGEGRVDASLKGRLAQLKRVLIS